MSAMHLSTLCPGVPCLPDNTVFIVTDLPPNVIKTLGVSCEGPLCHLSDLSRHHLKHSKAERDRRGSSRKKGQCVNLMSKIHNGIS